jgi:DNA-binding beta-propeller fold protein YncE
LPDNQFALVADSSNYLVRRVVVSSADVSTFAGNGLSSGAVDDIGSAAKFGTMRGLSISPDGTFALVADTSNQLIRKVDIPTASVTTFAGVQSSSGSTNGVGTNARFSSPFGVCISPDGSFALTVDSSGNMIRHIVISTASVTTLAGTTSGAFNGIGTNARFNSPRGVTISPDGLFALVTDAINYLIRHIVLSKFWLYQWSGNQCKVPIRL